MIYYLSCVSTFNAAQLRGRLRQIKERSEPHRESRGMLAVRCQLSFIFFQERKDKRRHGAEEKPLQSNQVLLVTVTRAKPKPLIELRIL